MEGCGREGVSTDRDVYSTQRTFTGCACMAAYAQQRVRVRAHALSTGPYAWEGQILNRTFACALPTDAHVNSADTVASM